jgi:hypothetical protein
MKTQQNLLRLVADLVEMLKGYGANPNTLIELLTLNGFTLDEIAEWYGIEKE